MMKVPQELSLLTFSIVSIGLTLGLGPSQDMEFTFLLPAGSTECFYQTTSSDDTMEVEYQVIAGSGLDVGFVLISPSGHRLASDFKSSAGIHRVESAESGDYKLCFDNSFSKLAQKMIIFEVIINRQNNAGGGQEDWANMGDEEILAEYKMDDIRRTMDSVYQHLERSRQVQTMLRAFEARDRYLLEDNLWRVSFWSCLNLLVIFAVAVTQIYTVRRLFDENKRVRT